MAAAVGIGFLLGRQGDRDIIAETAIILLVIAGVLVGRSAGIAAAFRFLQILSSGEIETLTEGADISFSTWCVKFNYRSMDGSVTKMILGSSLGMADYRNRTDECVSE